MITPDLTNAPWRKSSYSSAQGQCVEVASLPGAIAARDSKDPKGPALLFSPGAWHAFIGGVTGGKFRP
ncbi:MAG: DUF397 domain-containing protein [Streptomycetaceae bacterium]|nr:DUF397 domain-containing protein [Streptomycetaceae bacterium]